MAVQAIVPVIIVFGAFLIRMTNPYADGQRWVTNIRAANAPRWLISKGRKEDAIRTLEKVRPKEDVGTYNEFIATVWGQANR